MIKKGIIALLIGMFAFGSQAQNIQFKATAKNSVRVGEKFRLVFTINEQGSNFMPPSLNDFNVLIGPSSSSSSSMQIINGQVSRSVEITYSYVLQAVKEGTFTLQPAKITIGNNVYQSNQVNINVLPGDATAIQQDKQNKQGNTADDAVKPSINEPNVDNEDLFMRAYINKSNPMMGEEVIVTFKIYTRIAFNLEDIEQMPAYKNFWSYDLLKGNQNYPQYTQIVNGKEYNVIEIGKAAIYPQKSGRLTIDPMKVTVLAKVREQNKAPKDPFEAFFNDSFFGKYKTVKKTIASNTLNIDVKALPTNNQPESFKGAVGSFNFVPEITSTEINANDAITIKLKISGKGNLSLIETPAFKLPPDFEAYDPKINENISTGSDGVSGSKTFEYLIIPRVAGEFSIPPLDFTYFDLSKNKYITYSTPEYNIKVGKGSGSSSNTTYTSSNKEDIKYIGSDIRYIETKPIKLMPMSYKFYGSLWFYLLIVAPFILFALILLIWKEKVKQNRNIAALKNRKANKTARKRLKKAKKYLQENQNDAFFDEISKSLWGYLADKLNMQIAELTKDNVIETFNIQGIGSEIATKIIEILDQAEFARFAPGNKTSQMENIYDETIGIIEQFEKQYTKLIAAKGKNKSR